MAWINWKPFFFCQSSNLPHPPLPGFAVGPKEQVLRLGGTGPQTEDGGLRTAPFSDTPAKPQCSHSCSNSLRHRGRGKAGEALPLGWQTHHCLPKNLVPQEAPSPGQTGAAGHLSHLPNPYWPIPTIFSLLPFTVGTLPSAMSCPGAENAAVNSTEVAQLTQERPCHMVHVWP